MPLPISTCLLALALCGAILAAPVAVALCGGGALLIEALVFYFAGSTNGLG